MERKVDKQVAAPAEREHPTCTERRQSLNEECGWKGGDSGSSAGEKPCPTKKRKNPLDSDRPSHGRRLHSLRISVPVPVYPPAFQDARLLRFQPRWQRCAQPVSLNPHHIPAATVTKSRYAKKRRRRQYDCRPRRMSGNGQRLRLRTAGSAGPIAGRRGYRHKGLL
jgi:hypothetical protein